MSSLITLKITILDLNFREEFIQTFRVGMKKMAPFGLYQNIVMWIGYGLNKYTG